MAEYKVYFADQTSTEYQYLTTKTYIPNYEKSEYIPLYLSGNVEKIMVVVDLATYNSNGIENISINEKIPFEFNFARFSILLLSIALIYCIKFTNIFNIDYSEKNIKQELI